MRSRRCTVKVAKLATLIVAGASAAPARAELVFALQPTLSIGYTDNAAAEASSGASNATTKGDGLAILSSTERLLYRGTTAEHEVGYRLAVTRYFNGRGVDSASHEVAAISLLHLSRVTDLRFNATGSLSRTSSVITAVGPTSTPQAAVPGSSQYLSVSAGEDVTFESDAAVALRAGAAGRQPGLPQPAGQSADAHVGDAAGAGRASARARHARSSS